MPNYKTWVEDFVADLEKAVQRYAQPRTHLDANIKSPLAKESSLRIAPPLQKRYEHVIHLLRLVAVLLGDEMKGEDVSVEQITQELNPIVSELGCTMKEGYYHYSGYYDLLQKTLEEYRRNLPCIVPASKLELEFLQVTPSLWQDINQRGCLNIWYNPLNNSIPPNPDFYYRVGFAGNWLAIANRTPDFGDIPWKHFLPIGRWGIYPTVQELTGIVNYMAMLLIAFNGDSQNMWSRVDRTDIGYRAKARQYTQAGYLMEIAWTKLWHGFNGVEEDPYNVVTRLIDAFGVGKEQKVFPDIRDK